MGERRYRTLNGQMASASKIVGYCRLHKVHLTEPQLRQKQCLQKNCFYLKRWDHPFWDHRERIREVKKIKKEQGIPPWEEVKTDREGKLVPKRKKRGE